MDNKENVSLTPSQQAMADIWNKHTQSEFETRSAEDALDTMVEDPHVNHIPVLTVGVGWAEVRKFYSERFIP